MVRSGRREPHSRHAAPEVDASPRPPGSQTATLAAALLVVASLVAAVHWPVLRAQAHSFDDNLFVENNALVTRPSWDSARRFFTEVLNPSSVGGYYLPVTMTSLMIDCALGGRYDDLTAFHRTHLALHVLTVVMLGLILHALFRSAIPAALAALLFGLHPLTVEPVAWVSERKTLLATFFSLLSIYCYLRKPGGGGAWRLASLGAFLLALLSKPTVTPLPLVLLVLDRWPLGRKGWGPVVEKWPWFLLAVASAVVTTISQIRTAPIEPFAEVGVLRPMFQVAYVLTFYLGKIVWPVNLSVTYQPPGTFDLGDAHVLVGLAVMAVTAAAVLLLARRLPALPAGALVFLIALSPTFAILKWSHNYIYDRYLYFPALGIVLVLGGVLAAIWETPAPRTRPARAAAVLMVAVAAILMAIGTRTALAHWSTTATLWRQAIAVSPAATDAHHFLAMGLEEEGDLEGAESRYRWILDRSPDYIFALINLGSLQSELGRFDEAAATFERAGAIAPLDPNIAYRWGMAEKGAGRLAEAEAQLLRALELDSLHIEARDHLGTVQVMSGRPELGIATIRRAAALSPMDAHPYFSLGMVLLHVRGPNAEALESLQRASQLKRDWVLPLTALSWVMATCPDSTYRDAPEALRLAERALSLVVAPSPEMLDGYAAALAANGRFERAAAVARDAAERARRAGRSDVAEVALGRAAMYERGEAYVDMEQRR